MNNSYKIIIYSTISILCIIAAQFFSTIMSYEYYIKYDYYNQEIDDIEFLKISLKKFNEIRTYNITEYNCVNYSNDFMNLMSQFGYDINLRQGCMVNKTTNETLCHMWNQIKFDIEAQKDYYYDPSEEYPLYQK